MDPTPGTTTKRTLAAPPLVRSFLVAGTAPGVGKTLVAAALVRSLCRRGVQALAMKAVARGRIGADGAWHSDELERLAAAGAFALPLHALCPRLVPAHGGCAARPDAALALDEVIDTFQILSTWADTVVVDDCGELAACAGLALDGAALACALKLPVVLVAGADDGERALACLDALERRGAACAGWIANRVDPVPGAADPRHWRARLPVPLLGAIPRLAAAQTAAAAHALDVERALRALG